MNWFLAVPPPENKREGRNYRSFSWIFLHGKGTIFMRHQKTEQMQVNCTRLSWLNFFHGLLSSNLDRDGRWCMSNLARIHQPNCSSWFNIPLRPSHDILSVSASMETSSAQHNWCCSVPSDTGFLSLVLSALSLKHEEKGNGIWHHLQQTALMRWRHHQRDSCGAPSSAPCGGCHQEWRWSIRSADDTDTCMP